MSKVSLNRSDPRVKQFLVGLGVIIFIGSLIGGIWYGGTLPGFLGEWFAAVLGFITTPFLMEASFMVLGLLIVIALNYWRLRKDGDELVYLDEETSSAKGPKQGDMSSPVANNDHR